MAAGLFFSRPKPVFAVQNGINWDKPVFPNFPVQSWEKLSKTGKNYTSSSKTFMKCNYQTKIEQDRLEDNLTKKLWAHNPKFVKKVFALILIQIIYSGLTMLMSHQLWCQAMSVVVTLLLCKNKMYRIWLMNSQALNCEMILSLLWTCFVLAGTGVHQAESNSKVNFMFSHHLWIHKKYCSKIWDSMIHWLNITWTQSSMLYIN